VATDQLGLMRSSRGGTVILTWLGLGLGILLLAGCEDDVRVTGKYSATQAPEQTNTTVTEDQSHRAQASATQSGPIVGQRTTDIRNAAAEVENGDAKAVKPQVTAKEYVSLQGNAYVSIIGRVSILKIQQAMDLYHAQNDRYPKDYDEFMTEIIKANSIALPQLPPYQKYGYDEPNHKLVIIEYPALKNQPPPE
jgi:hypothetical protein